MRLKKTVAYWLFAVPALAAGLISMTASAAQSDSTDEGKRAVAGPEGLRLYHVNASAPNALEDADLCLDKEAPVLALIAKLTTNPEAVPPPDDGCTQTKVAKPNASFRLETICGSPAAGHMSTTLLEGRRDDFQSETKIVTYPRDRQPETVTDHRHMTYLGECPPSMKAGDFRTADGKVHDPVADLQKALGRLKGLESPQPSPAPTRDAQPT